MAENAVAGVGTRSKGRLKRLGDYLKQRGDEGAPLPDLIASIPGDLDEEEYGQLWLYAWAIAKARERPRPPFSLSEQLEG